MPEAATELHADRRYTIAICKGAGLVSETRQLMENWRPGECVDSFVRRVLEEDLLGRFTAYRSKDIVRRVFANRFLLPTDRPARLLKRIIEGGLPNKTFTEMLFLFACRADALIYDFTSDWYWEAIRRGRTKLSMSDVRAFFAEAVADGRIPGAWSEAVQIKIARGLLGILRDVGYLREERRGVQERDIIPYHMSGEGVACLARELSDSGLSDSALCEHADWKLFGLNREAVIDRLDRLGEERGLIIQRAGSVVSITWRVKSMKELIDVLAG
jgi:AcrR family transcriptional regulator